MIADRLADSSCPSSAKDKTSPTRKWVWFYFRTREALSDIYYIIGLYAREAQSTYNLTYNLT